jgi:hypothetical protein
MGFSGPLVLERFSNQVADGCLFFRRSASGFSEKSRLRPSRAAAGPIQPVAFALNLGKFSSR